jgi:hypothetical protein
VSISDLITPKHLERLAMIYIRQSSPQQVLSNQESLRLQYALQQRAKELGWSADRIEVIDTDLGMTAAAAGHRQGFKELLAKVTLGEVQSGGGWSCADESRPSWNVAAMRVRGAESEDTEPALASV